MNLETKIITYKFTPQVFTLTHLIVVVHSHISVASILCNKRALTLRWFCLKPDVWSKKGCTVFLFVTRRHQLAKGDIPHNQLASNESDNAERSQEKQIADSTDSR